MSLFEKYLWNRPFTEKDKAEALADYRASSTDELWDSRLKLANKWYEAKKTFPGLRPDENRGNHPQEYGMRAIEIQAELIDSVLADRNVHSTSHKGALNSKTPRATVSKSGPASASRSPDPEIAKREAIIDQNLEMSAAKLCSQFDLFKVPLPDDWFGKFQVDTWAAAYKNRQLRGRIDSLISKARHRQG